MLVFGIGAGLGVAERAEVFLPREVGRKTGNQVCTLSMKVEKVIIATLTKNCSNRVSVDGPFQTKKA